MTTKVVKRLPAEWAHMCPSAPTPPELQPARQEPTYGNGAAMRITAARPVALPRPRPPPRPTAAAPLGLGADGPANPGDHRGPQVRASSSKRHVLAFQLICGMMCHSMRMNGVACNGVAGAVPEGASRANPPLGRRTGRSTGKVLMCARVRHGNPCHQATTRGNPATRRDRWQCERSC